MKNLGIAYKFLGIESNMVGTDQSKFTRRNTFNSSWNDMGYRTTIQFTLRWIPPSNSP
jgi:hypothetical protein